ncbi:MAG: methyltransferase family protein, partial [Burkholderiales bacterium]
MIRAALRQEPALRARRPGHRSRLLARIRIRARTGGRLSRYRCSSSAPGLGHFHVLWCIWDFASFGRGTPAPIDLPRHLVARGFYRYSRNPMYIGVLSVVFGWSLLFQSGPIALYGLVLAAGFHLFVVLYEEPHLRRAFGSSYEQYCARVGRWLSFRRPT